MIAQSSNATALKFPQHEGIIEYECRNGLDTAEAWHAPIIACMDITLDACSQLVDLQKVANVVYLVNCDIKHKVAEFDQILFTKQAMPVMIPLAGKIRTLQ